MTTYSTYGSIRGSCGHRHHSQAAAEKCRVQDMHICKTQHGYSDRAIVIVGKDNYLYSEDGNWIKSDGGNGVRIH